MISNLISTAQSVLMQVNVDGKASMKATGDITHNNVPLTF
jgi:hypothetical protein